MNTATGSKIKIVFVLPTLKAGGAERVISAIVTALNTDIFKPTLLVIGHEKDAAYDIPNVHTIFLNKNRVLSGIPGVLRYLIQLKPDIAVGSISHVSKVLAFASYALPKTKFVGREASVSTYMKQYAEKKRKRGALSYFMKDYFKRLDAIISQSDEMKTDLMTSYGIPEAKMVTINNPIAEHFSYRENTNQDCRYITVGSLSKVKGHDRILRALSKLHHEFSYTIVGSGNKKHIEALIEENNLTSKVSIIDFTKDVPELLAKHTVFLSGSYVEGFPNALLESCAVGTPALAFKAPGGLSLIHI